MHRHHDSKLMSNFQPFFLESSNYFNQPIQIQSTVERDYFTDCMVHALAFAHMET